MDTRKLQGLEIAARVNLKRRGELWIVPSQSGNGSYEVTFNTELEECACSDYELRHKRCKHIWAVHFTSERDSGVANSLPIVTKEPTKLPRPTYRQNWTAYNAAQMGEKRNFRLLLCDLCRGIETPLQQRGRPAIPLADVLYVAIFRAFLGISGRRSTCDIEDAADLDMVENAMHFNTVYRALRRKDVTAILLRLVAESSRPLALLEKDAAIDSTGMSTGERVPWYDKKYGRDNDYTAWRKLHFLCGVNTHIVIAAIPSPGHDHDDRYFRALIDAIPPDFRLKALSADKAYLSKDNFDLLEAINITPYIPFKRDSVSTDRHPLAWQYMYAYYQLHRDQFLAEYHKRSNAESVVSMIKAKYGERLRSKTPTSQDNEVLTRVIAHNIYVVIQSVHEHHLEPEFWAK